jgi:hypothetical protein
MQRKSSSVDPDSSLGLDDEAATSDAATADGVAGLDEDKELPLLLLLPLPKRSFSYDDVPCHNKRRSK